MQQLKNFKPYTPEMPALGAFVIYLQDESGHDWYAQQRNFADDTLKIAYDAEGVIVSIADDVSALWPVNLSVAEVGRDSVPVGFTDDGHWVYDGESITPRRLSEQENAARAKRQQQQLLDEAYTAMKPLELAVKRNMATDEEKAQLDAWERYSVMLSRVKPEDAAEIVWPDKPE